MKQTKFWKDEALLLYLGHAYLGLCRYYYYADFYLIEYIKYK